MDDSFKQIFLEVLKKWYWIVLVAIIGGLLGYVYCNKTQSERYVTSVESEVCAHISSSTGDEGLNYQISRLNYEHALIPTIKQAIDQRNNIDNVIENIKQEYVAWNVKREALGLEQFVIPTLSRDYVRNCVTVTGGEDTDTLMLSFSVSTTDPYLSVALLNAYVQCASEVTNQLEHDIDLHINEAQRPHIYDDVDAEVVATNGEYSVTREKFKDITIAPVASFKYVVIGALVFAALFVVIFALVNTFDTRIRSDKELKEKYNLPVLAVMPVLDKNKGGSKNA